MRVCVCACVYLCVCLCFHMCNVCMLSVGVCACACVCMRVFLCKVSANCGPAAPHNFGERRLNKWRVRERTCAHAPMTPTNDLLKEARACDGQPFVQKVRCHGGRAIGCYGLLLLLLLLLLLNHQGHEGGWLRQEHAAQDLQRASTRGCASTHMHALTHVCVQQRVAASGTRGPGPATRIKTRVRLNARVSAHWGVCVRACVRACARACVQQRVCACAPRPRACNAHPCTRARACGCIQMGTRARVCTCARVCSSPHVNACVRSCV